MAPHLGVFTNYLKTKIMSQLSTFVDCPQIQASLLEAWNYNNLGHDGAVGLKFILDPINRDGFLQGKINHKANGLRDVQVVYDQRFLESDVSASGVISCTAGGVDGETSTTYELDPTVGGSFSLKVTPAELRARCQRNPDYIRHEIKKMMDAIIEKADTDFLTTLPLNTGNFADDVDNGLAPGTTSVVVTTTKDASGTIVPDAYQDVRFHFSNNRFSGVPYGFGTKIWNDYALAQKAACCSQLGLDVKTYAQQNTFGFSFSHKMAGILGNANEAIFIAPGSVQMLKFNEFEGPDGSIDHFNNGGVVVQDVLTYPDAGLPLTFDYRAEYVCEGLTRFWLISLAIAYKFIYLPTDMFQVGDRLEGVNGVNEFRITNP